jgi:hypothetical protein
MAEIIRPRRVRHEDEYCMVWDSLEYPGSGYSFPCDAAGVIDTESLNPAARENLMRLNHDWRGHYTAPSLECRRHRIVDDAIIKCECCGHRIQLYSTWANGCDHCHAEYNGSGQRLADRCQWGEETGETAADLCVGMGG